jgi:predicted aspartyl protease
MKFRYVKYPAPKELDFFGKQILRPVIPIEIVYQDRSLQYETLIDSGADFCIFHAEVGKAIGIDVTAGQAASFGGIQKSRKQAKAYFHPVTLVVGGWKYDTVVSFSDDIAPSGSGVLGEKGFFDLFVVKFDFKKGIVELKEKR